MFTFRKFHGCDSAHLNLRDQWWKERDNHKTIGLVSLDLSKTFDMLPHDLIVLKLGKSIADEKTICMACRVVNNAWNWGTRLLLSNRSLLKFLRGSIVGPLILNIFINDRFCATSRHTICRNAKYGEFTWPLKQRITTKLVQNSYK